MLWVGLLIADARPAHGQVTGQAPELAQVDVDEHLGQRLPGDVRVTDHEGRSVRLGEFFDGTRPVLFTLAYHRCEILCNMVLNGALASLADVPWTVGKEFTFVSLSIDPRETPAAAADKRRQTMARYEREAGSDFHFLVASEDAIERVADATGFRYFYDERNDQYAHPAVVMLLTPDGKLARYLYGIQFDPGDIRLGLLEASEGRSISTVERVLMYCYRYDPQAKAYGLMAMRVMQIGGGLTAVLLFGFLGVMFFREHRAKAHRRYHNPNLQVTK
jgi:protein SCO1/2